MVLVVPPRAIPELVALQLTAACMVVEVEVVQLTAADTLLLAVLQVLLELFGVLEDHFQPLMLLAPQ